MSVVPLSRNAIHAALAIWRQQDFGTLLEEARLQSALGWRFEGARKPDSAHSHAACVRELGSKLSHVLKLQQDSTLTCPFLALSVTTGRLMLPRRHVIHVRAKWLQCMLYLQQPHLALLSKRLSRHIRARSSSHSWCAQQFWYSHRSVK